VVTQGATHLKKHHTPAVGATSNAIAAIVATLGPILANGAAVRVRRRQRWSSPSYTMRAAAEVPAATGAPPPPANEATGGAPASALELPAAPAAEGMAFASDEPTKLATWRVAWAWVCSWAWAP
jgi:hypothetical protein